MGIAFGGWGLEMFLFCFLMFFFFFRWFSVFFGFQRLGNHESVYFLGWICLFWSKRGVG